MRRRGRESDATEGKRERERRGMDGRWIWCGVSPGVREKWEREGENERDGGKWIHMRGFAVFQKFNFFF